MNRKQSQCAKNVNRVVFQAVEALERRIQFSTTPVAIATTPLVQDWSNPSLITADNDWSNVPGIVGYSLNASGTTADIDPRTITVDRNTTQQVLANESNPNGLSNGGIAEFDSLPNPVVAFQGSGTADSPYLQFFINSTGVSNVSVAYLLRDVDGSSDDAPQQVNLQYRAGTTGAWQNVTGGYVADATEGGTATKTTPINVHLPSDAGNNPNLQIRVMTTNANGNDEWVGVDNIVIGNGTPAITVGSSSIVTEDVGNATVTVTRFGDTTGTSTVNYTTVDSNPGMGTATPGSDYTPASGVLTFGPGDTTESFNVHIIDDFDNEPTETIKVQLSAPTNAVLASSTSTISISDNDTPPPTNVFLNEVNDNPSGVDDGKEYIEIEGTPGQALHNVYVASVEGDSSSTIGQAKAVFSLDGITLPANGNGLLLIKSPNNTSITAAAGTYVDNDAQLNTGVLENGTNSFLVLYSPTGLTTGTNLDPDKDGTLNLPAGAILLDGAGWSDGGAGDRVYGTDLTLTLPSGVVAASAATRIVGTTDTLQSSWYDGVLIESNNPDEVIYDTGQASTNIPAGAKLTPGAPNYVGTGSTAGELGYSALNYSVLENANSITITVNRTAGSTGTVSVDYSTIDSGPGVGTASSVTDYTPTSGTLTFTDGNSQSFQIPILDDSTYEPSETINLKFSNVTGGAIIGPRATATVTILDNDTVLLLNEIDSNPPLPGSDNPQEFVEFEGTPNQVLPPGLYFASVEGDTGSTQGKVTAVIDLSGVTVGSNGLILVKSSSNTIANLPKGTTVIDNAIFDTSGGSLQNNSNSFVVLFSPTVPITTSVDLDGDDNGSIDLPNNAVLIDGIGVLDGTAGDHVYAPLLVTAGISASFAATRIVNDMTQLNAGSWYAGNLTAGANTNLTYITTGGTGNIPAGATLTPGDVNFAAGADTTPPTIEAGPTFVYDTAPQSITIDFSESVLASFSTTADISLVRHDTSGDVPIDGSTIHAAEAAGNVIVLTFPSPTFTHGALPDGNYTFTLHASGITDAANNVLAGGDKSLNFFVLGGDANHDGAANALDFNALATNFGQSVSTYHQGDFTYDGSVNSDDFDVLSANFGKVLPTSAPVPALSLASPAQTLFSSQLITTSAWSEVDKQVD